MTRIIGTCSNCGRKGRVFLITRNGIRREELRDIPLCPKCSLMELSSIIPLQMLGRVC